MESMISRPTPGQAKTTSMITEPAISRPMPMPRMVTTGSIAWRSPCRTITVRSGRPLARAVRMKSVSMTSIIPERVRRMMAAISSMPSEIAGRISACQPTAPPVGTRSSRTAKKKIIIRPSQKPGTAWPTTASERASQSTPPPRRNAAATPSGTAVAIAKASAAMPSLNVFQARAPIESIAETPPPTHECPKSPWKRSPRKFPYCTIIGSLRPKRSLMPSMSSLVASGPARNCSGFPTSRETRKTRLTTMKTTTNACSRRTARKFKNCIEILSSLTTRRRRTGRSTSQPEQPPYGGCSNRVRFGPCYVFRTLIEFWFAIRRSPRRRAAIRCWAPSRGTPAAPLGR